MRTTTVEPLLTHTPRWMARAMGYERLPVMGYERALLLQNNKLVPQKSMGYVYEGLWAMRGMGYDQGS